LVSDIEESKRKFEITSLAKLHTGILGMLVGYLVDVRNEQGYS
jgi:hypothetical protein